MSLYQRVEAEDCISREQTHKVFQALANHYQEKLRESSNAVHEAAMGGRMFGYTRASEIVLDLPSVYPKSDKSYSEDNTKSDKEV